MSTNELTERTLQYVDVSRIVVPPELNRWTGNPGDIDLQTSIETHGILQPPGVIEMADGILRLVFGTRRVGAWRNSTILRDQPMPVLFLRPEDAIRGTIDENVLRRQLSAVEKAKTAMVAWKDGEQQLMTQEELAESLGVSDTWLIALQTLWEKPELWARVESGDLPITSAVKIAPLPEEKVREFLANLDSQHAGASTREIKSLADACLGKALTADVERADDRGKALDLMTLLLQETPATGKVSFHVEWVDGKKGTGITVRMPIPKGKLEEVRSLLAKAESAYGTIPDESPPAESPTGTESASTTGVTTTTESGTTTAPQEAPTAPEALPDAPPVLETPEAPPDAPPPVEPAVPAAPATAGAA